jgi:hypothetical protein
VNQSSFSHNPVQGTNQCSPSKSTVYWSDLEAEAKLFWKKHGSVLTAYKVLFFRNSTNRKAGTEENALQKHPLKWLQKEFGILSFKKENNNNQSNWNAGQAEVIPQRFHSNSIRLVQ